MAFIYTKICLGLFLTSNEIESHVAGEYLGYFDVWLQSLWIGVEIHQEPLVTNKKL